MYEQVQVRPVEQLMRPIQMHEQTILTALCHWVSVVIYYVIPVQYSCLENPMDGGAWWTCGPWGRWESDTTERLHLHFSLSCIGEGNGNPLQCSCLENPRDGGAWWAAVYGVAQSRTRLKLLSNTMMVIDTNTKPKENIFKRICKEVELEKVLLYSSLMICFN